MTSYRARKRGFAPQPLMGVEIVVVYKDKKSVLIEIVETGKRILTTREEYESVRQPPRE